jgi:multiple sugar transport system permease protein
MTATTAITRNALPDSPPPRIPSAASVRRTTTLLWIAQHSIGIALGLMFLGPVVFLLLTSFMSSDQTLTSQLWPLTWHPEN